MVFQENVHLNKTTVVSFIDNKLLSEEIETSKTFWDVMISQQHFMMNSQFILIKLHFVFNLQYMYNFL